MKRHLSLSQLCLLLLFASTGLLHAEEIDPIESGRKALRDSANYPWYDRDSDGLRDLHAKAKASDDTDTRKHGWEIDVPPPPTSSTRWNWNYPTFWQMMQYAAMALLVALVVVLVFLLIRYFIKEEDLGSPDSALSFEDRQAEIDRVEQLPFVVRRPGGDLLGEARKLYDQGSYGEAIVYLYSYQLVQLDRHQVIHLAKGKTNRQYLREIRELPTLRGLLQGTMIAFEDVFFGHHDLDRQRFDEFWQRLDEFHALLERQGATA
jgi:hypothetical protein